MCMFLNSLEYHILRLIKDLPLFPRELSRNLNIPCFALFLAFLQVLDFIVNEKQAVKSEIFLKRTISNNYFRLK